MLKPATAATVPSTNLPAPLTSFIGREREVNELQALLATTRLLTLTGAGGCGKTRLALRVAERASNSFPDGVWLVELAALADPALVAQSVATAVGLRETAGRSVTESLVDYLRGRTLLLVLDNCEHVVAAGAQLVDSLLRSCPRLHVLATSREPLGCAGETTWRVPSLNLPTLPPREPLERLAQYEAIELFIERAWAAVPGFAMTSQNAAAVIEICHHLDGIPLAIELAAARVRVFSVEQIAQRLDDRFHLLTTGPRTALPRQQTLRATVEWSYVLLSEPERRLLLRLAVFAGGWTFEAAEAVASGDDIHDYAVLDLLAQLVDKSLVIAEEHRRAVRYRMLETIRQFALNRLQEAGEAPRTRDRHLSYFLALAEEAELTLRGAEQPVALARLEEEHANLRVALEWSLTPRCQDDAALRLSGALAWFWWLRSYHDEARRWLERALAARPARTAARMKTLHGAGFLAHHRRNAAEARDLLGESLGIAEELDDRWTIALVLHHLGRVAYFDDDPATARSLGEQSLAMAEEVGDRWLIAWALHLLGLAAHIAADYPTARMYYSRSLAIRQELGYREGVSILLFLIGSVAVRVGDLGQAYALYREGLTGAQAVLGPWGLSMPLANFSHLAAVQGQPLRAVRLGAAATALSEASHTPLIPIMEALLKVGLAAAREALGETAYAAAWAEGWAMTLEQSLAEAFSVEVLPPPTSPAPRPPADRTEPVPNLTAAETRVLRLLARGQTTKEIAAELLVAVSTIDRHLTHIYDKLGVRNRAEATARALKHGLV